MLMQPSFSWKEFLHWSWLDKGGQGRKKLQRSNVSDEKLISPLWMDSEREDLVAYEYLCRVGEAKEYVTSKNRVNITYTKPLRLKMDGNHFKEWSRNSATLEFPECQCVWRKPSRWCLFGYACPPFSASGCEKNLHGMIHPTSRRIWENLLGLM